MVQIRALRKAELDAADEVIRAAFGRTAEVVLAQQLREDGDVLLELGAFDDRAMIGHVLFSRLAVASTSRCGPTLVAALAPVSVRPARQQEGIGATLVRQGLEACGQVGIGAVLVLGDPAYYGRFGFSAELASPVEAPFAGPAFMALELVPAALAGVRAVRYPDAFGTG